MAFIYEPMRPQTTDFSSTRRYHFTFHSTGNARFANALFKLCMYSSILMNTNIYRIYTLTRTYVRHTYIQGFTYSHMHASIFQFLNLFATFRIGGKQTCMARTWFYSNAQCLSALRYRSFQTAHSTRSASRASSSHLDLATNIHNIMHADYGRKEGGGGNDCDGEQTCV